MARRLSYAVYDAAGCAFALLAAPVLPVLLLTRHGRGLGERLGCLPAGAQHLGRPLWLHAASVGEVLAAEPLVRELRRRRPEVPIVVSTTSLSGRDMARARLGVDAAMLLPADIGWIVARAMRRLRPRCLIVVETELWPALLRAASRQRVPAVVVSGRVSARAAARYASIRWLTRAMLSEVRLFAMQSRADAERIVTLGAPPERVVVVGSLKFARGALASADAARAAESLMAGRPLLVAASTHAPEEELAVEACRGLWAAHPEVLLLIAPRRPGRFEEVYQWLVNSGLRCERRSRMRGSVGPSTQVLLLDTIGELLDVLPVARAVFVGGTIAPVGGHNVLEPAMCGRPVMFGPHTSNVGDAANALLAADAAVRVRDAAELRDVWERLVARPDLAEGMGERGRAVVAAQAEVAARTFDAVHGYLDGGVE